MKNLLIAGNCTMPTSVGIFNLPALETCTPSKWCREHCYALKNRFLWSCVKEAHKWRYKQSKLKGFVKKMISEISKRKSLKYIRVHITGDFYSYEYMLKWAEIARAFPNHIFRTNTKSRFLLKFMKDNFPSNFIVRESIDSTRKPSGIWPVAAIWGTIGSHNFFTCVNDCEKCKFYCWKNPNVNVVTKTIL
jgi:hypothetical protein